MVDHISSPSAIVFPIAALATELHKLGVLLLVDGAHAPGWDFVVNHAFLMFKKISA